MTQIRNLTQEEMDLCEKELDKVYKRFRRACGYYANVSNNMAWDGMRDFTNAYKVAKDKLYEITYKLCKDIASETWGDRTSYIDIIKDIDGDCVERLRPSECREILGVKYDSESDAFYVVFNGKTIYELKRSDVSDLDNKRGILQVFVNKDCYSFHVIPNQGDAYDIPWDLVLYHCEPEYKYYKTKEIK